MEVIFLTYHKKLCECGVKQQVPIKAQPGKPVKLVYNFIHHTINNTHGKQMSEWMPSIQRPFNLIT